MHCCEICGREFKNASGLSGHKQLAHRTEPNGGPLAQRTQEPLLERVEERLTPMVERIDDGLRAIIERIDDGLGTVIQRICEQAVPAHKPGLCQHPTCQSCEASHMAIVTGAEKQVHQRLERAVEALGMTEAGDRLAQAYNNIVEGKEPLDGLEPEDDGHVLVNIKEFPGQQIRIPKEFVSYKYK